eukprot:g4273.t1
MLRGSPFFSRLKTFRHKLHSAPRVSNDEFDTALLIEDFLKQHDILPVETRVGGGAGLIYEIVGEKSCRKGEESDTILLRSDMDALPLVENTGVPYTSTVDNCHHACGHDGHSAMLAGALIKLQHEFRSEFCGRVMAIFQPAEETGDGAKQMINASSRIKNNVTRGTFGLHNIPGAPLGQVMLREGVAARSSVGVRAHFKGVASHASEPHLGSNPLNPITRLLSNELLSGLPLRLQKEGKISPQIEDPAFVTPVHSQVGQDGNFGVIPADGLLCLSLRADTTNDLELLQDEVASLISDVAKDTGCSVTFSSVEFFPACMNDKLCTEVVKDAASTVSASLEEMMKPFPWSEDFGYFAQHKSGGVLFGLGAGEDQPALHSENYDFPDELLPHGVDMWCEIACTALGNSKSFNTLNKTL